MAQEKLGAEPLPYKHFDLIVVGAGPAGAATILRLAQSGLRIAWLDKSSFPRDKICGDALSGKVLSFLRQITPNGHHSLHAYPKKLGTWGVRFSAPSGEVLDVPFKLEKIEIDEKAPGYISRRIDFDHFLVEMALERSPCTFFPDFGVKEIQRQDDCIRLSNGKEWLSASLVIGADGAHSIVNKKLGNIPVEKAHYSAGVRAYYQGVTGFQEENFIELHFLKDLLPGYFWIFPLANGAANVGLGMLSRDLSKLKLNLRQRLLEVVAEHPTFAPRFQHAHIEGPVQGFGLPLGSKKRAISGDRFMLTGDAAALIDPFTGEGIGNALVSGKTAAEQAMACFEEQNFSADFLKLYDERVYRLVWSELRLSHQMQKLIHYPWLFNFVVRRANKSSSIRTMLTMMFEDLDIRSELRKPSFYWRLLRS